MCSNRKFKNTTQNAFKKVTSIPTALPEGNERGDTIVSYGKYRFGKGFSMNKGKEKETVLYAEFEIK